METMSLLIILVHFYEWRKLQKSNYQDCNTQLSYFVWHIKNNGQFNISTRLKHFIFSETDVSSWIKDKLVYRISIYLDCYMMSHEPAHYTPSI